MYLSITYLSVFFNDFCIFLTAMIRRVSVDNNLTQTYAYGQSTQVGRIGLNLLAYILNVYIQLTLSHHGDQVTEPNKHNLIRTKNIY